MAAIGENEIRITSVRDASMHSGWALGPGCLSPLRRFDDSSMGDRRRETRHFSIPPLLTRCPALP